MDDREFEVLCKLQKLGDLGRMWRQRAEKAEAKVKDLEELIHCAVNMTDGFKGGSLMDLCGEYEIMHNTLTNLGYTLEEE